MMSTTSRARPGATGALRSCLLPTLGLMALLACGGTGSAPPAPVREGLRPGLTSHKVRLSTERAEQLHRAGVPVHTLADYGAFSLVRVEDAHLAALPEGEGVRPLDESNDVLLNAGVIDTASAHGRSLAGMKAAGPGRRMHLVQFVGPIQPEWYAALEATGVRVVAYIPHNAYLVSGDAQALEQLRAHVERTPVIQWNGDYLDDYKLDASLARARTETYSLQLLEDAEANPETLGLVHALQAREGTVQRALGYVNVVAALERGQLARLVVRPDVVSIQPYFTPEKADERQALIAAGQLSGSGPGAPGYLAWLSARGFTQARFDASGFGVDLTDSGVDNGTTLPNHFGLYKQGDITSTSRLVYSRLEGTPNSPSTLQGCDGHGALNAHILAGHATRSGTSFTDASGYTHGVGVAPFVRLGSSVVFDPNFTYPSYENLTARAYRDGMRISNNSWGSSANTYTVEAQRYDALVRDAQPTSSAVPAAGNQEMVIVFAAGNLGSTANSVRSPGTAKNVITVGASENVRAYGGADSCGYGDPDANSAFDLSSTSSRGPTADGRKKPDLVAPGTHVLGGVPQSDAQRSATPPHPQGQQNTCFTGADLCGGPATNFFPDGQQWFAASSGTSYAAPVVAGGAALVRQHFINQGRTPPSAAMTKAFLLNSTRYLTGAGADDSLFSNNQGMGLVDLGRAFDGTARILSDQTPSSLFTATGQTNTFSATVADTGKPVRITLAWTDAPGSTTGAAWNNDLDLTVVHNGTVYKGNAFSGAYSRTGGTADGVNNVESVFLLPSTSGSYTVTVTAANITSDGVPGNSTSLDQDFALVLYNANPASTCASTGTPTGLSASAVGNNRIDLSWNASSGAASYTVYRTTSATGFFLPVANVGTASFSDTGLSAGTRYSYSVSANACTASTRSSEVSAVTGGACAQPPAFSGVSSITSGAATTCTNTLTWSAATPSCGGTLSYSVYRSTTSGFTPSAANRVATAVSGTSFSDDANLTRGTAYYYVVRATEVAAGTVEETNTVQRSVTTAGTSGTALNYSDDFDNSRPTLPHAYWTSTTAQGTPNTFNIVTCRYQSASRAYRFGPAAATGCGETYPINTQAALILGGTGQVSSTIDGFLLPAGSANAQLSFALWYSLEQGYDGFWLSYSTAGAGGPWTNISDTASATAPFIQTGAYDGVITGSTVRAWSGTSLEDNGSLRTITVNLNALAGQRVWLGFNAFSDSTAVAEGVYLDNVRLSASAGGACSTRTAPSSAAVTYRVSGLSGSTPTNTPVTLTLTALDAAGNTAASYTGNALLTSSDAQATLPSSTSFSAGVATVSVTFKSAGAQTVTARDSARASLTGGASTQVLTSPATRLVFSTQPGASVVAGAPFSPALKVTLLDSTGNPTTGTQSVTLALANNPGGGTPGGTLTVSAVSGVATFSNVFVDKVGTGYTLSANASGLPEVTSTSFQVTVDAPAKLTFLTPPGHGIAGEPLSPAVRVAVVDRFNNRTSSTAAITVALDARPSGATLSGTSTVNAVDGVATFSTLSLTQASTGYTLGAASASLTPVTSGAFTIAAAAPARLAFTQQPTSTSVGAGISPAVKVALQDTYGNPAGTQAVTLSLAHNPGGATLGGTPSRTPVAGVATFDTLSLDRPGTGYTLSAAYPGLAPVVSTAFNVGATTATQLVFTTSPPSRMNAGARFTVQVEVRDGAGAPVSSTAQVTLSLVNAAGATLGGTSTVNTSSGVATFSDLQVGKAGTDYALQASVSGVPNKISSSFSIDPGSVAVLVFSGQPGGAAVNQPLTPGAKVSFQDTWGNAVPGASGTVTVALGNNPSGAVLAGTRSAASVNGVATFNDLSLDRLGEGYTLVASANGYPSVTSAAFAVVGQGSAAQLVFKPGPTTVTAGPLGLMGVELQNASGQRVADSRAITLTLQGSTGGALTGTSTVTAQNGLAAFNDLALTRAATGYRLMARANGLPDVLSAPFDITPGSVQALTFTVPPSRTEAGAVITPALQVALQDAHGNRVTEVQQAITLAPGNNPRGATLQGTLTVTTVNGVATFPDVSITRAATGYTLVARTSGAVETTSSAFDIVAGAASALLFTEPPRELVAGSIFVPAVKVAVVDALGNPVPSATPRITLTLGNNPGGGSLTGATAVPAVEGVASFGNLGLDRQGTGYTLIARADPALAVTSPAFSVVSAQGAARLVFTTEPKSAVAGVAFGPVRVELRGANGSVIDDSTREVAIALGENPRGDTLLGTTPVRLVRGVATFDALSLRKAGSGYTLVAATSGAALATSTAFTVTAGPAARFLLELPASVNAGQETELSATAYDLHGNAAPSYSGQARVTSSDARAVFAPVAPFSNGLLSGFKVTFHSGGQTTVTLTDEGISGSADLRVDTFTAPTVALSEPRDGASVSGDVTIIARGSVAAGTRVARIAILVDGQEIAQGTESSLSTVWDSTQAKEGTHQLTATLTDAAGNTSTSAPVSVTTRGAGCGCGATSGGDVALWLGLFALVRLTRVGTWRRRGEA